MKKMLKRKSKGFTLVELLIVVIIIGILAGMMMLSTGGATAKAEATKIVSDMRNMKAAAVMVYSDANEWPTATASLDAYLDQIIKSADYKLVNSGDFIERTTPTDTKVQEALAKLADSGVPLFKTASKAAAEKYVVGTTAVFMPVK